MHDGTDYLIPGTDVLLALHFTHSSKFKEAPVIKIVLDAQVVTIPVEEENGSGP